jgi:tetratricopeptide (TPR) repeat protein
MKLEKKEKENQKEKVHGHSMLLLTIFAVWVYVVSKNYYHLNPIRLNSLGALFQWRIGYIAPQRLMLLLDYLLWVGLLFMVLLVAYFLGKKFLKWLRIDFQFSLEETVFSVGLGFGVLAYMTLFLGLLGLLYTSLFYGLIGVIFVFAIVEILTSRKQIVKSNLATPPGSQFGFEYLPIWILLGSFVLLNFIMSFTPELFYDSLVYHLGASNYYVIKHRICEMPYNVASYYPFNIEMLYTLALLLKQEGLPKLINFSSGILCLGVIFSFCKRYFTPLVGIIACAIFYSIPLLAMNSWVTGNDVALSYFFVLSIYALINYFSSKSSSTNGTNDTKKSKWFILSAIFSGIAMGSKYTGVFTLFGILLLITCYEHFKMRKRFTEIAKQISIFTVVVVAIMSPWLIKNMIYTGNPIYPFLYKWLGGKNLIIYTNNIMIPSGFQSLELKEFFTSPWTLSMKGQDSMTFIGPMFLLFIPLLFFVKKKSLINYLILFFIFAYIPWGMVTFKSRYLLPALPALSIVIAWSLVNFVRWIPKYFGRLVPVIFAIFMGTNLYSVLMIMHFCYNPFNVLTGLETRDHYLSLTRPGYPYPSYEAFKYINENLPQDVKIMIIGEAKVHYLKRDFIYNDVHNFTPVVEWTKVSKNGDELYVKIKEEKITHILINTFEAGRNLAYGFLNWNEEEIKIFDQFWQKYIQEIYSADYGVHLLKILSPEESHNSHPIPRNYLYDLFYKQKMDEMENKKVEEQIVAYKNILEKNPEAIPIRVKLGEIYLQKSMWDEAVEQYQALLRMGLNVYPQLGYLYGQKKNYDSALNMFQRALEINPDSSEIHRNLSIVYLYKGDRKRAIDEIKKAIEIAPGKEEYQNILKSIEK